MAKHHVYALGFAFATDADGDELCVFLNKTRGPKHLLGRLNGVGGKLEAEDFCEDSKAPSLAKTMVREFLEETGIHSSVEDWVPVGTLSNSVSDIFVFYCELSISAETACDNIDIHNSLRHHSTIAAQEAIVLLDVDDEYWKYHFADDVSSIISLIKLKRAGRLDFFTLSFSDGIPETTPETTPE